MTPGYPMPYSNDLICEWLVLSSSPDRKIVLDIVDFEMENSYDFLIVGNGDNTADQGSTIAKLTGRLKLRTLTSMGSRLWLKVVSDRTGTRRGFKIDITRTTGVEGT